MPHSLIVPVIQAPEYRVGLEHCDDLTLVHCTIDVPWTSSVRRRALRDFGTLLRLHGGPLYALEVDDDPRHPKFLRLFRFRVVGTSQNADTGRTVNLWMTQRGEYEEHHGRETH